MAAVVSASYISVPFVQPNLSSDPQGPDVEQELDVVVRKSDNNPVTGGDISLHFFASELQLRGIDAAEQPHHDVESQNILCLNGEVSYRPHNRTPPFLTTSAGIRGDRGSSKVPLACIPNLPIWISRSNRMKTMARNCSRCSLVRVVLKI